MKEFSELYDRTNKQIEPKRDRKMTKRKPPNIKNFTVVIDRTALKTMNHEIYPF